MKYIDNFYSYRTYSGNYEGTPPPETMYRSARNKAEKFWGYRPTIIIDPVITIQKGRYKDYQILPTWTHIVWVSAPPKSKSEDADGSELVIIWYSEESCFNGFDDVIAGVDWEKNAEDFGW